MRPLGSPPNLLNLVNPLVIESFRDADADGDGVIGAQDARGFFARTGLPPLVLARARYCYTVKLVKLLSHSF